MQWKFVRSPSWLRRFAWLVTNYTTSRLTARHIGQSPMTHYDIYDFKCKTRTRTISSTTTRTKKHKMGFIHSPVCPDFPKNKDLIQSLRPLVLIRWTAVSLFLRDIQRIGRSTLTERWPIKGKEVRSGRSRNKHLTNDISRSDQTVNALCARTNLFLNAEVVSFEARENLHRRSFVFRTDLYKFSHLDKIRRRSVTWQGCLCSKSCAPCLYLSKGVIITEMLICDSAATLTDVNRKCAAKCVTCIIGWMVRCHTQRSTMDLWLTKEDMSHSTADWTGPRCPQQRTCGFSVYQLFILLSWL